MPIDHVDAIGPRTSFERFLSRCSATGSDPSDAVHKHFEALRHEFIDWVEVADEGRRVWRIMIDERTENYSPGQAVFDGIAAAGYYLALDVLAVRLGISADDVMGALEECRRADTISLLGLRERK